MLAPRPFRALALAIALGTGALAPAPARADAVHVVSRGQTLFWIAKRYRTTPEAIRAANGLREGQLIHPGLSLSIPGLRPQGARVKEESAKTAKDKNAKTVAKDARDSKDAKGTKDAKDSKDSKDAKGTKDAKDSKDAKSTKDAKSKTAKDSKKGAPPPPPTYAARPKRPGFVTMLRGTEKLEAQLLTRGQLNRAALPGLSKILRHAASDAKKSIDPRLAYLVGLVSDHFGGRTLHVVSGYRPYSKRQYTPNSNHNHGRAMDFAVEGVPNTVVRDYCRTLRDAGVGYYPNSTFVHLDVRTGKAYWIDYSGPGEAPKYDARQKSKADESRRDVEGTDESGSGETHGTSKQPADSKGGTPAATGAKPASTPGTGAEAPTPPKAGSPTAPKGVSSDPYL